MRKKVTSAELKKFDRACFPEIALLLVHPIVSNVHVHQGCGSGCRRVRDHSPSSKVGHEPGGFAQIVIGIRHIRKIRPFGKEKIESN
jgi:hypothetical protein